MKRTRILSTRLSDVIIEYTGESLSIRRYVNGRLTDTIDFEDDEIKEFIDALKEVLSN